MADGTDDSTVEVKRCPNSSCGQANPAEARYCAHCGESLGGIDTVPISKGDYERDVAGPAAERTRCPRADCGHENFAHAKHCAGCGKTLQAGEDSTPPETDKTLTERLIGAVKEVPQPFIDLIHAPRALWGINLAYVIEGMVYFGMLGYLAMYFNEYVGLGDVSAGHMVMVLTAGITIAMFFLGGVADKWGVRFALLAAFCIMFVGRALLSSGPSLGAGGTGLWSSMHLIAMAGILLVVIGYGMYQPAAYAGVKQFTNEKTAAMGYAMLYALMNLGGWLPTYAFLLRNDEYLGLGISGTYWVYASFTLVALMCTFTILTRRTVQDAITRAKAENATKKKPKEDKSDGAPGDSPQKMPEDFLSKIGHWIVNHPLADAKFAFFIFALIPVQTLFAHNWLTLPMYVNRAFRESWPWISENFEPAVNFNPLLIFILVPIVTALTMKKKVYNMMILGTFVMAAPTFLLAFGAEPWTLIAFLLIMTLGEAMWQPRFLQYAAEIAPEGRTGAYMGVAQFPWFLTKMIVPLYSGWFLQNYCPMEITVGPYPACPAITVYPPVHSETMWLVYACIAMISTVLLILAKRWVGKDFKTKAD
jgi:POT family proton-dependent oligopeptide transporter